MDTTHPAHPRGDDDLHINATADGRGASELKHHVRAWLARTVDINDQRCADIVLATYEALANCADHAYRNHQQAGHMTLHVSYDNTKSAIQICVEDQGRWISPDTEPTIRGRGLPIMKALASDVSINGRDDGTTICLHFDDCPLATMRSTAALSR